MFSFDNPGSPLKEGLQREPFEITVLMKREKLQALRSDFTSTREQGDHPNAARAQGSDGREYTNTQTQGFSCAQHTSIHTNRHPNTHSHTHTESHLNADVSA